MKFVFPETKSFCFCIPLRYGLLIWGLLKLLPALLYGAILIQITINFYIHDMPLEYLFERILMLISYFVDICFTINFIYATYKKNLKLLKLYFYYSLIYIFMFLYCFMIASECEMSNVFASVVISDSPGISPVGAIAVHNFTFFLEAYLIVLVNSMIEELKREGDISVENGEKLSSAPTKSIDDERY